MVKNGVDHTQQKQLLLGDPGGVISLEFIFVPLGISLNLWQRFSELQCSE